MKPAQRILLRFHSNIEQYAVTVYDGCNRFQKQVFSGQGCLTICSHAPYLRVVVSPLQSGYSTTLYYWIDARCASIHDLYFPFPQDAPVPPATANTFTLTDVNYDLPIDGTLFFTQT